MELFKIACNQYTLSRNKPDMTICKPEVAICRTFYDAVLHVYKTKKYPKLHF